LAQSAPQPQKISLGPGFWPVTIAIIVWSVASGIWIAVSPLDYMVPAASQNISDRGNDIDFLFRFMSIFANAIMSAVVVYIIYFAIVFRRRRDEPASSIGIQIHDAPKLELWWSILPTLLVILIAAMSIRVWALIQFGNGAPALSVEAIGHQFKYEFRYPGLNGSVWDEMHLPAGRQVRVLISSADVLHSFWVPEFRLKADTVPGLVQNLNFTPQKTGTYLIECTEFCGLNHSLMWGKLVVDPPDKFDAWLAAQKAKAASAGATIPVSKGNVQAGAALFSQKCSACHTLGGFADKRVGPGLGAIFTDSSHPMLVDGDSVSPEHVEALVTAGYNGGANGVMPSAQQNGLSGQDVANVSAFLASRK